MEGKRETEKGEGSGRKGREISGLRQPPTLTQDGFPSPTTVPQGSETSQWHSRICLGSGRLCFVLFFKKPPRGPTFRVAIQQRRRFSGWTQITPGFSMCELPGDADAQWSLGQDSLGHRLRASQRGFFLGERMQGPKSCSSGADSEGASTVRDLLLVFGVTGAPPGNPR